MDCITKILFVKKYIMYKIILSYKYIVSKLLLKILYGVGIIPIWLNLFVVSWYGGRVPYEKNLVKKGYKE